MTSSVPNLKKYYRLPGLTVPLPTKGAYLPTGSITFSSDNEVEVFPMVLADEMMLKNPDALMSGSAIQSLFESCVPAISSPALISAPDIDVLLLAIRVATYGRTMELETSCPNCEKDLAFDCNLPDMLLSAKECVFENEARLSDEITVRVRPFNVQDVAYMSRKVFEEERRLQQIELSEELSQEQRQVQRNLLFKRMSTLQSNMLAKTIMEIVTPEGSITDNETVYDFISNIPAPWVKKIDEMQKRVSEGGMDKTVPVKCSHCEHEWKTAVDFDPSSFFDQNSSD